MQPISTGFSSQIFKTYSNSLGEFGDKIGFSKRSLAEWSSQVQQSFYSGANAAQQFGNAFQAALIDQTKKKDYHKISGKIVTSKNIDSYIPEMTNEQAAAQLISWQNYDTQVKQGIKTWTSELSGYEKNNKWQKDFIQNTDLQRASVEDLTDANKAAREAAIMHNESIKAQTISAKLGQTAMKGLSMSLNMIAFAAISFGIEKFVSWIDETIHHSERLQEAAAEARSSIKNIRSSFEDFSSSANNIKNRYAELAQGVDQFSGKNANLSTEDYQEFLSLGNQLSEMFPNLTRNYDENGNAILNLTGNISSIVDSLDRFIEDQERLSNMDLMEHIPDSFTGYAEKMKEYTETLTNVSNTVKAYQTFADKGYTLKTGVDSVSGTAYYRLDLGKDISTEDIKETARKLEEGLEALDLFQWDDYSLDLDAYDADGTRSIKITAITKEAKQKLQEFSLAGKKIFSNMKTDVQQQVYDTKLLIQQETANFLPSLYAMLDSIPQFTNALSEEQQETIRHLLSQDTSWITSMYDELGENANAEDITEWMLKNILHPIIDSEELQFSLSSLFKPEAELTPEQMISFAESLSTQLKKHKIQLSLDFILNPDIEGSAASIDKNLNLLIEDTLKQKYGIDNNTLFSTVSSDTKESYSADRTALDEFIKKYSVNTQDEIAALHDALEEADNNLNKAFTNYLFNMENQKHSFEFNPSSFADSMNNLASINALSDEITSAAEAGADFTFQTSEIEKLRDELGAICPSFDEFEMLATSSSASVEELQAALDQLFVEALIVGNSFDGLNSSTRDSIVSQLEMQNVSNASEIITERVAEVMGNAAEQQLSLADAADIAANGLLSENDFANGTANSIYFLAAAEIAYNNTTLDTQGKIMALQDLSAAFRDTASSALAASAAANAEAAAKTILRYQPGNYEEIYNQELKKQEQKIMDSISDNTGSALGKNGGKQNNKSTSKNTGGGSSSAAILPHN